MAPKTVQNNRTGPFPWPKILYNGIFLFLVWMLFSGKFDLFHLGTGVAAVVFVLWLDRRFGSPSLEDADVPLGLRPLKLALYVPWLFWQMLRSSIGVAKVVLQPSLANPALVTFRSSQPHVVAKVVLGNSITLTPGTLTLGIEGDRFLVHALSDASASSLLDGKMQKKVAELFSQTPAEPVREANVFRKRITL